MTYQLPPLPFEKNALEPIISAETIEYHYSKHHQTYADNLNKLIKGTPDENKTLEEIIMSSSGGVFNNAGQIWNHNFYWNCLSPKSAKTPKGELLSAITKKFGSFDEFKKQFSQTAITTFGSGWGWLVKTAEGEIELLSTSNANTPMQSGKKALLTCDVWEHAYYIDYRNARATYVEKFWDLVNWDFVEANFK